MDTEGSSIPFSIPFTGFRFTSSNSHQPLPSTNKNRHGMPWRSSISKEDSDSCMFMPFWEWQLAYFEQELTNFKLLPLNDTSLEYVETKNRSHRMVTLVGTSDEYRWIRMTYMDGGKQAQVYTSVCYPRDDYPILGIDLLQFGGKRHLTIVDFQPLGEAEEGAFYQDVQFEHLLEPIRQTVPSLQHPMTNKFYDPDRYFSKQTLLGRFQSTETVWQELWPAYQAYVRTHVQQIKQQQDKGTDSSSIQPPHARRSREEILKQHSAYDTYVAARDPAHPMFASLFGHKFANDYLYQVLFPLAERNKEEGNDDSAIVP